MTRPLQTGTRLGTFEIRGLLGSGGMASVYRAFDQNLQRLVAVKVLSTAATQPDLVARFQQEALVLARLHHPNIVPIYDVGQQDELVYMVQELLPGPTLQQRLAEQNALGRSLGRADVLVIIRQLADALDAAHAAGIIHRDVKPANALWNAAGALVLTDFGVAKDLLRAGDETQAGLVLGTPAYVSPEQAQGLGLTPASDIYALSVVLYELLVGQPPFVAATPMALLLDHIRTLPPSPRLRRPDLPPEVVAVVFQGLAKEPSDRFARAGDLARALAWAWPAPATAPVASDSRTIQMRQHGLDSRAAVALPSSSIDAADQPVRAAEGAVTARPQRFAVLVTLGIVLPLLLAFILLEGSGGDSATAPDSATQATATLDAGVTTNEEQALLRLRSLLTAQELADTVQQQFAAQLDQAAQALEAGNKPAAAAALTRLQQQLLEAAESGELDPQRLREALSATTAIADQHDLDLALSTAP